MIDLHCHILPDVDDGPATVEESMALCHMAVAQGITDIVATPHLDNTDEFFLDRAKTAFARLTQAIADKGLPLRLHFGAEVMFFPKLSTAYFQGRLPSLAGTKRYLLVEFSDFYLDIDALFEELFALKLRGLTLLLAHPERNPLFQKDVSLLVRLVEAGCLGQLTAGSLTGTFGNAAKLTAALFLDKGLVHVMASDAHCARHRASELPRAIALLAKRIGDPEVARQLTTVVPGKILRGEPYDPLPLPEERKRSWRTWLAPFVHQGRGPGRGVDGS